MQDFKTAILMLIAFTIICGGIYPVVVTGIAQSLFPQQADGSLMTDKTGRVVGSVLIGQPFSDPKYFWPRPSATTYFPYNPAGSGGSNLGPTNPAYLKAVAQRVASLRAAGLSGPISSELIQASASGLDPHITPEAANLQLPRVAGIRGMSMEDVAGLIAVHTEDRQLGFLGEPRVNVLALNLALDKLAP
ncbi:MAG: potassium-transporting ATPase subunit KdpC [Geobacteraceae bacterium]|nr:potassium-transporting ATPase subunit KdpC [Geobacteraceae bacterium]